MTTALSVAARMVLITPVGIHRVMFRQRARRVLMSVGQKCAIGGLGLLGLAVTGVVLLISTPSPAPRRVSCPKCVPACRSLACGE